MRLDERDVIAHVERLSLRELRLWVREGWVRPAQGEGGPVFDELDVARLELICDLRKDMAITPDVMPTVLTLIDNLHRARRELRLISEALDEQPAEFRRAVLAAVRRRTGPDG